MGNNSSAKPLAENRRARFDYDILETYEAGLELTGGEVKSVKEGKMQISGSYALIRPPASGRAGAGEAWLTNSVIPPYQPKNVPPDYDPGRNRRLLLRKEELKNLSGRLHEKGLSLLPLRIYAKRGLVKVELGLGRSRKKGDKRDLLKKRAVEREIRRN
jgi:SsrA-binding protein